MVNDKKKKRRRRKRFQHIKAARRKNLDISKYNVYGIDASKHPIASYPTYRYRAKTLWKKAQNRFYWCHHFFRKGNALATLKRMKAAEKWRKGASNLNSALVGKIVYTGKKKKGPRKKISDYRNKLIRVADKEGRQYFKDVKKKIVKRGSAYKKAHYQKNYKIRRFSPYRKAHYKKVYNRYKGVLRKPHEA